MNFGPFLKVKARFTTPLSSFLTLLISSLINLISAGLESMYKWWSTLIHPNMWVCVIDFLIMKRLICYYVIITEEMWHLPKNYILLLVSLLLSFKVIRYYRRKGFNASFSNQWLIMFLFSLWYTVVIMAVTGIFSFKIFILIYFWGLMYNVYIIWWGHCKK